MFKNELRPYEISLWTLQDSFISVLKAHGIFHRGQIETPKCQIKNDGTQELSFSIPMYYRENGVLVENPIWYNVINGSLIANLRKLKVIFNKGEVEEEVFEFVINKVTETHTDGQLRCEVFAESLSFQELGKVGYKISLSSQDFLDEYNEWYESTVGENSETEQFDFQTQEEKNAAEPINNLDYWCQKIFKNSYWSYEIQMDWSAFDGVTAEFDNDKREELGLRRTDKVYEEEYISSWKHQGTAEEGILIPAKIESFKEKLRLVDLEKSNIYNLTQDLAQTFGVFCKYKYDYDENYHIIGKRCIFYNNFLSEKEGKIDIIYPYSASKITREIDSADIVTKMFVTPMEDSTSPSGLITIADVTANKMREDYILNFDYLYSIGTITQEQYDYIADYERSMYLANIELEPIAMQIANLQNDLVKYQAQQTFAREAKIQDKEQMEQAKATKETVMSDKPFLVKSKENPIRGTLLKNEDGKSYYVNITQEGIDYKGENKYLLSQYSETIPSEEEGKDPTVVQHKVYAKGIRLFYYAKIDETIDKVLKPYEDDTTENPDVPDNEEPPTIEGGIYPSSVGMEFKNGNLIRLTNLQLKEDAISNSIFIACAYSPELHYQNIYDFYLEELAKHEALDAESTEQIKRIENTIETLTEKYEELLAQKEQLIADFENMMGPALREGSWQAESYTDYGSKYEQIISVGVTNSESHINFVWDTEAFEEEQLLYYSDNGSTDEERKTYYYAIDLSSSLDKIKNNLNDLSFLYDRLLLSDGKEIVQNTYQMTIGSQACFAFIDDEGTKKPILLLLDKAFIKEKEEGATSYNGNFRIGLITTEVVENEEEVVVEEEINTLISVEEIVWVENLKDKQVFPRLKSDSLLLKISDDELIINIEKQNEETLEKENILLRNYYEYSILIREENYYITIKPAAMLINGNINKTFNIAYSISNAATSLYLDALEVSKTNASPQVSYTLEVSAMNKNFIKTAYQSLNRIVSINDAELKFEDVQGYISELDLDLDNPWEDSITIQNYKTKFEDLFSTIVASTEQMKVNSFAYNNAASAFGPGGTLKPSIIQNTISQTDLTYAFQSGNLTIDEINGIWARSDAGVVAMRGGGIFCATEQDSNGNWLWNTGIMPSGINASLITAGQIDTNLIKIYAGDNLRLQLNQDGLFAYQVDSLGEANLNRYIVHNSEGLFSTVVNESGKAINLVEVSWDGFKIRDSQGNFVFNADTDGNLTITGTIKANTGNIGNWEITSSGLWYNNGTAGLIPDSGVVIEDSSHALYGHEKMLWVERELSDGVKNEFVVTSDGTLYCNDIIAKGTISAGSIVGNTTVGEIDNQLRAISVMMLDGTTFSFANRNYDGNLIVSPQELKFRIYTNALTEEELCAPGSEDPLVGYNFYYAFEEKGEETDWKQFSKEEANIITNLNYLTFILKSDIMYTGLDIDSVTPHSILYIKVEKEGKQRIVDASGNISYSGRIVEEETENEEGETVTVSTEKPYLYSDIFQLVSEKVGLGKHVSPIDPPSYTFVEDKNKNLLYEENPTTTFSTVLTGFTMEEASKGYWLVNGGEERINYPLYGSNTETEATSADGSVIISDEEEIIVAGETVEENDEVGLGDDILTTESDGIVVFLTPQEDGTILAHAVVSYERIPEGGNIKLTFKIDQATRDCFCFKTRNGSDGINIIIRSSSGDTLTSGDTDTDLSVEIYYGVQQMNADELENSFFYVWKKGEVALSSVSQKVITEIENAETTEITVVESLETILANPDNLGQANIDFFKQKKIYITTADFGLKAVYRCDVFSDLESAIKEYLLNNENEDESLNYE